MHLSYNFRLYDNSKSRKIRFQVEEVDVVFKLTSTVSMQDGHERRESSKHVGRQPERLAQPRHARFKGVQSRDGNEQLMVNQDRSSHAS